MQIQRRKPPRQLLLVKRILHKQQLLSLRLPEWQFAEDAAAKEWIAQKEVGSGSYTFC